MKKSKKTGLGLRVLACVGAVLVLLAAAFFVYTGSYYRADAAGAAALQSTGAVQVRQEKGGIWFDGPGEEDALIFYPGAKVEHTAYAPLLAELAAEGVDCYLVEMPFHLAIFGMDRAGEVMESASYARWYLGGHSLGGAMAASWAQKNPGALRGLVLLAAYPTGPLQAEGLAVLSVYGSEDGVLNMEKVEQGREYMPLDYTELCLAGGNHAGFGAYGPQKGDGAATLPREEQWRATVDAVLAMTGALAG